jgi:preprotein translocase subunit SecE
MTNIFRGLADYIRSSKAELEKVTWPSRRETLRYGLLVISVTIVLALFFSAIDFGLQKTIEGLLIRQTGTPITETNAPVSTSPATMPNLAPIDVQTVDGTTVDVQTVTPTP